MRKRGFLILIVILFSLTHFADELQMIDSLKRNLSEVNNEGKIENYLLIAEYYRSVDVDSTIKYGILAIKKAQEIGNREREAFTQRSLGVSYIYISDNDNAMYYFRQSLRSYKSINHELGISNCYNGIGKVFERKLELDSAEYFLNIALQIRLELNDFEQIAASYVNIGNIKYFRNQLTIALDYYLNALLITKKLGISDDIGDAYINLGIIYNELNKSEKALNYFNKADSIFLNINNVRAISTVRLNKADIYNFHFKDYNKSIKLYKESLKIKTRLNEKSGIALINNNMGTVYGNMEDYKLALIYLEKARQMYSDLENKAGLIMVNHNLGNVYFAQGDYERAINYFSSSLSRARETGFNDYIVTNYEPLIKAYSAIGDYENFEKYFNLDRHVTDSLLSNLNQAKLTKVEANFIASELQKENHKLKDYYNNLNRKATTRVFIIIGLAILILIGIIFQILYYYLQKKKHLKNS